MLIVIGMVAIVTLVIGVCIWFMGQIRNNGTMSQQQLNKNNVYRIMSRYDK